MTTIKAPYTFVPLDKRVVTPHWADAVSHDLPFEDGLSGTLTLHLEAISPIFVRDGVGQATAEANRKDGIQVEADGFNQHAGRYFVPGTSLKGVVRNVLEIMSFGRLENKVVDHRYAVRDFQNNEIYDPSKISKEVSCGWLRKEAEEYHLTDCGRPGRISHEHLAEHFKNGMDKFFQQPRKDKSACFKIKEYPEVAHATQFEAAEDKYGLICTIRSDGSQKGKIVFTGQPSPRKPHANQGKHLEFVFLDRGNDAESVPDEVARNFRFAYYDHDRNRQTADWKYWQPKLDTGERIPVFFRRHDDGTLKDLGLSFLYKIIYKCSVKEAIRHTQGEQRRPDLAEAIFGYVDEADKSTLKGRVRFGHAFALPDTAHPDKEKKEVLAAPKASYYPNYVHQTPGGKPGKVSKYQTFMDENAQVAGWKRYPVHAGRKPNRNPPPEKSTDRVVTKFRPLKAGARFEGTVYYHNLRPVELGALLSALTFHGTPDTYHALGMAKPLGYGKVRLTVRGLSEEKQRTYLSAYEAYLDGQLLDGQPGERWHQTPQVRNLVATARVQQSLASPLKYMSLREHFDAKKAKEYLRPYVELSGDAGGVASACEAADGSAARRAAEAEKLRYTTPRGVEQVGDAHKEAQRNALEERWRTVRDDLLRRLDEQQQAARERERQAVAQAKAEQEARDRQERQEAAKADGPNWDGIDLANKKAFDTLKNETLKWGKLRHERSDKELVADFPEGYLDDAYHAQLLEKLQAIYQHLTSNRAKKEWQGDLKKSKVFKEVVKWVGPERAAAWQKEI